MTPLGRTDSLPTRLDPRTCSTMTGFISIPPLPRCRSPGPGEPSSPIMSSNSAASTFTGHGTALANRLRPAVPREAWAGEHRRQAAALRLPRPFPLARPGDQVASWTPLHPWGLTCARPPSPGPRKTEAGPRGLKAPGAVPALRLDSDGPETIEGYAAGISWAPCWKTWRARSCCRGSRIHQLPRVSSGLSWPAAFTPAGWHHLRQGPPG